MKDIFKKLGHSLLPYVAIGAIMGFIMAFVICGFVWLADICISFSSDAYVFTRANPKFIPLLVLVTLALALLAGFIIKYMPEVRGGGIPYIKGLARGKISPKGFFRLPVMAFSTLLSLIMGLPLGKEGSAVFIGGNLGYGGAKLLNQREQSTRILTTAGACSALAIVFNAPLMGIFFALEEGQKRLNSLVLVPTVAAVIVGMLTKNLFFGDINYFDGLSGAMDAALSIQHIGASFFIGIATAGLAVAFNMLLLLNLKPLDKIPTQLKILLPAILVVPLRLISPLFAGAARDAILSLTSASIIMMVCILLSRFFLLFFCSRSGASGGVFIQIMALGACIGGITSLALTSLGIENDIAFLIFMGASGMLAASLRTPFTAIIFVFEMTALSFSGVLAITASVMTAYTLAELVRSKPLYEELLAKTLMRIHGESLHENEKQEREVDSANL